MNKDKIVLSFPFSGALYSFIDKTILDGRYHTWSKGYYTWLFGKNPDRWQSMALTFTIIYPEIILVPRDHPLPKKVEGKIEILHSGNSDLGIIIESYNDNQEIRNSIYNQVEEDIKNSQIQKILQDIGVHPRGYSNILYDIRYEMYLATKHNARIVCARGRKRLINYLIRIDNLRKPSVTLASQFGFVEQYINYSQLEFNMDDMDTLYAIKEDEYIIQYAKSFRNYLDNEIINKTKGDINIPAFVEEALASSKLAKKYSRFFNRGARILSWVNLLPIVGSIGSSFEKSADITSEIAEKNRIRHEWFDLAPEISKVKTRLNYRIPKS